MKTRFICSAVYARERFHGLRMIHSSLTVNKIITKSASIFSQIYDHPFNYQLKAGSLPIKSFQHYIEQDRHYLRKFALALQIASERLTVQSHKHKFKQFAGDMLETERELHEKYLGKLLPYSLFSQSKNSQQKEIPVIANYTRYLLHKAQNSSVEEAVISLLPCFYIYMELGKRMQVHHCKANNPYLAWIASYSSQQFKSSTEEIIRISDELLKGVLCVEKQIAICASFRISAEYEYQFFDAIYSKAHSMKFTDELFKIRP